MVTAWMKNLSYHPAKRKEKISRLTNIRDHAKSSCKNTILLTYFPCPVNSYYTIKSLHFQISMHIKRAQYCTDPKKLDN